MQSEFLSLVLDGVRCIRYQSKALTEMTDSFKVRRSLDRTTAGREPIAYGFVDDSSLCIVACQHLGLSLGKIRALLLQNHRNPTMQLLPLTLEQAVVRGLLDQSVLEPVRGFGRQFSPVRY